MPAMRLAMPNHSHPLARPARSDSHTRAGLRTTLLALSAAAWLLSLGVHAQQSTPIPGTSGSGSSLGDILGLPPSSSGGGTSFGPAGGLTGGPTGGMCTPSAAGAPCGGAGPASQGNTSGVNTGAGNPIDVITGNKHQTAVDMAPLPGVLGLEIVRHYNSAQRFVLGQLGAGWRLSYETDLYRVGSSVQIVQADGRRLVFEPLAHQPARCASADPQQGWVEILNPGATTAGAIAYRWHWTHGDHAGRRLDFNAQGRLVQVVAPTGEILSLTRGPRGELLRVIDPQGRELRLSHGDGGFGGIARIDAPVGRFEYRHGESAGHAPTADADTLRAARLAAARLTSVRRPDGTTWLMHHEDPRHPLALTGVSLRTASASADAPDGAGPSATPAQRLSTWAYDERGRAVAGHTAVALNSEVSDTAKGANATRTAKAENLANATNAPEAANEGKPAMADPVRLVFVRPPSSAPGPAGEGITRLTAGDSPGPDNTTWYRYRAIGGQWRLTQALGAGCRLCGPVNRRWVYDDAGTLVETQWLALRPHAAATPRAPLRAAPTADQAIEPAEPAFTVLGSVRHRQTTRPAAERVVEFIPYRDGRPQAARLIERQAFADPRWPDKPTRLSRPSVVPGREAHVELRYDDTGQPLELTQTGFDPVDGRALARTTRWHHERRAGRSLLVAIDGPLVPGPSSPDDDITRLHWDAHGRALIRIDHPGGRFHTFDLDPATGWVRRVTNDAGHTTDLRHHTTGLPLEARTTLNTAPTAPTGQTIQHLAWRYNPLGHVVEAGLGAPQSPGFIPQQRWEHDTAGQPRWRADARGWVETWHRDAEGRLRGHTVSNAWQRLGDVGDVGDLSHQPDPTLHSPTGRPWPAAPGSTSRRDDFGRVVQITSPHTGTTRLHYDEADRLVAMTDAMGHRAEYAHDVQGRILRQRITDARTQAVTSTEWRYSPRHLLEVIHPTQRERFEVDARGWRTARLVTLVTPQGEVNSVTRYEHDERGQLIATTLPDGSRLAFERNGQQQVVALKRQTIQTPWLRWLGREQTLAHGMERDLVGLSRYTTGHGIEVRWQRSAQGDLARLVHRHTAGRPAFPRTPAPAPVLLGRTTQETIERLLGIAPAHAQAASAPPPAPPASPAPSPDQPGALGLPPDPQALIDHRYLWSPGGLLLHSQQRAGAPGDQALFSHAYDGRGQLVASVRSGVRVRVGEGDGQQAQEQAVWRYAYDAQQRRVLSQQGVASQSDISTATQRSQFQGASHRLNLSATTTYNANGQPERVGQREYVWDALGRLMEVREEARPVAVYRYDHRGLRIAKKVGAQTTLTARTTHTLYDESQQPLAELGEQGRITRQYVWLADLPLAVIDSPHGQALAAEAPGLTQLWADVRRAINSWLDSDAGIAWLHTNHLGAPEAATNAQGQMVWRARYAPFGAAQVQASQAFTLDLRLPGQVWDAETGLHYNRQRYYDPHLGQYLSPDPLGTPDGPNPYAYVAFNPLTNIDPDGLILFAFDGTGNDESNPNTISNVVRFRDLYLSDSRTAFYITGPGTRDPRSGIQHPWYQGGNPADTVTSFTGRERIAFLINDLQRLADGTPDETILDIDVAGFSRGAAQARDFANQVANATRDGWYAYTNAAGVSQCQRVNLRFMGLFDTVLSVHRGSYNLGIPEAFSHVAHAVAMNEYRNLFPVESIAQGQFSATPVAGRVRIERGFLGAHSDIGGSFADGDLAKVALVWMVNQATAAGVQMDALTSEQTTIIPNPVLHDSSSNLHADTGPAPTITSEDRMIRFRDGSALRQRGALVGTGTGYQDTVRYITYSANPRGNVAGTVNMNEYLQWLNQNGYGINMTVQ